MQRHNRVVTVTAVDVVGHIAEAMLAGADGLQEEMDAAILEAAPGLAADASIAAETRASNRANLQRWVTAMVRRPGEPVSADVPPEALDIARSVVRRASAPPSSSSRSRFASASTPSSTAST